MTIRVLLLPLLLNTTEITATRTKAAHSVARSFRASHLILQRSKSWRLPPLFPKPGTFSFHHGQIYQTTDPTILHLAGTLTLTGPYPPLAVRSNSSGLIRPLRAVFQLAGFWSEASGALCMVGNGVLRPLPDGAPDYLPAVLKLGYPKSSNISTSVITGTLEILSAASELNHFDRISLVAYTQNMYNYTLIRKANESCTNLRRFKEEEEPLVLDRDSLCSTLYSFLSFGSFKLNYKKFSAMSLILSSCSDDDDRFHVFVEFSDSDDYNYRTTTALVPGKSMVGEGFWDHKTNRLCLLACPVLSDTSIGDCYVGLSFWFPSYLSIKTRSLVLGRMWSNKEEDDESYFEPIMLKSAGHHLWDEPPKLKYKYTKLDKVKKYFKLNSASVVAGEKRYPDGRIANDMRFSFSFQDPKGEGGWGHAYLLSRGETDFGDRTIYWNGEVPVENPTHAEMNRTLLNVTYTVSMQIWNSTGESRNSVESIISAEGLYSSSTGQLYLIGCGNPGLSGTRKEVKNSTESMDCEIFINMQLSPLNSERNGEANGTIMSTRDKSDALYFEPLKIASNIMYTVQAQEAIRRMQIEVAMVVISLTLYCIFTCLQIYHAKKNRDISPSISTTMLLILTLGHMIPLILNIEALFFANRNRRRIFFHSGHWIDAGKVIVRLTTMVALILQLRLLQVAWTARSSSVGQKKSLWATEGKTLLACLPLYIIGTVIAWFVRSTQQPLWKDLIAYAGLILDGFLLPQIIFNLFSNSNNKALTPFFYVGITVVRSMPHLYDAFRARHYFPQLMSSYIYAKPEGDFYSTLWDIIVPCEGLLFAALVYLQQRFGGRCFVPMRFREGAGYERVAVVSS
ncbi:uncharacterized protein LOC109718690 isoform X1 [Ananas comosus]|uniref:RING-type E3 ubiquitin transferase n=1 Tax=Ananas comosus TaxID=4615 RepID=A0A6P5FXA6_ANACO|nr:uncharacterized protein LOC109718690 isoform X1 [Ananas comosus]